MRRALIVGIDNYPTFPLSGCVNDANNMHEVLSSHHDGSPNFECIKLVAPNNPIDKGDPKDDLIDKGELRRNLEIVFRNERDVDVALFYFSGHGLLNDLGGWLVTQDASRYDEGFSMSHVLTLANNADKIREIVIILDCCHSGALGQVPALGGNQANLREGISILTASRDSQLSVEAGGKGVFTSLICDALKGGAADVLGNVSVAGVYAYADQALGAFDQRPLFKSYVSKLIPLRRCKPAVDVDALRQLSLHFPSPTYEFPLDPSYEPELEPRNEENERVFSYLQKYRGASLVISVGAEHLYHAAKYSKSCKLTPLGQFYWHLAKTERLGRQ